MDVPQTSATHDISDFPGFHKKATFSGAKKPLDPSVFKKTDLAFPIKSSESGVNKYLSLGHVKTHVTSSQGEKQVGSLQSPEI